jgi:hypothetical protein
MFCFWKMFTISKLCRNTFEYFKKVFFIAAKFRIFFYFECNFRRYSNSLYRAAFHDDCAFNRDTVEVPLLASLDSGAKFMSNTFCRALY